MKNLKKKYVLVFLLVFGITSNVIFAKCGSCEGDEKVVVPKKSSSLVTTIAESGDIEGFVIASCGMCNFGFKEIRGCNLTLKIEDKIYPVVGTSIHKHGDPHSGEGLCRAVRVAYVSGNIKDDKFYSDSFILIESPE